MIDAGKQMEIIRRGAVEIISEEELIKKLETKKPLVIKLGADPTAPDLHLGHTVVLRKMRQFQDLGHKVVFLIGDFTALIGDPTGKSETRKPLTEEKIRENVETYKLQVQKILDMDKTIIDFNSRWLSPMNFSDVLKLASKYTVARMLERDDFLNRFKSQRPISIHEFMYPLMQGYDSVALQADVELGGTDQKFNLLVGRSLQKEHGQPSQVIITMPILEGLDGVNKMSKSLGNYVGINEEPKNMYGKIMSISDAMMFKYYELLTDTPAEEIAKMKSECDSGGVNPKSVKMKLAHLITSMYHNAEAADHARLEFQNVFSNKGVPDDIVTVTFDRAKLKDGKVSMIGLISDLGFADSNSAAKRLIQQGGLKLNSEKCLAEYMEISALNGEVIVQAGKRNFAKVIF
jgi:tyrosyl-tRNA synthetase